MKLFIFVNCLLLFSLTKTPLLSHCQMPCGIYHDQMIYDKIDEYYETMVKAVAYLNDTHFDTVQDKNQFIRWIANKEKMSDEISEVIMTYFLQQKIKPAKDEDTDALVRSLHKMLFLTVQIKQMTDLKIVKEFGNEWEHFKELFHPEDKCRESRPLKNVPAAAEKKN